MKRRIISTLLVLAMLLGTLYISPVSVSAETDTSTVAETATEGLSFDADHVYSQTTAVTATPKTFEAWIKLPAEYATNGQRGGAIIGSLATGVNYAIHFEIYTNGNPSIYWWGPSGEKRVTFENVNVATGEWVHLVVSITDDNSTMYCYVNSQFKQQKDSVAYPTNIPNQQFAVGSDRRDNNPLYFKGEIKSAAIYDTLMKHEPYIVTNYNNGTPTINENTIAAYDLSNATSNDLRIPDLSANKNNLVNSNVKGFTPNADYHYSMEKQVSATPVVYEAWIKVPEEYAEGDNRAGVILGSYKTGLTDGVINFEVHTGGNPCLYWIKDGSELNIRFDGVNVATGEWVHVAIMRYTDGNAYCYIDGEYAQGKSIGIAANDQIPVENFAIGSDYRDGNAQSFKGEIKAVAIYNTTLHSENDIRVNYQNGRPASEKSLNSLMAYYDLSAVSEDDLYVEDLSGNDYTLAKLGGEHTFTQDSYFQAAKPIDKAPKAFEAWIKLPEGYTDRAGIIIGTVGNASAPVMNFEVKANGVPALYWQTADNKVHEITFSGANVATGDWVHLVITRYTDGNSYCYVNGVYKGGVAMNDYSKTDMTPIEPFVLGGDYRFENDATVLGNGQYFKGAIKGVAVYSEPLHSSRDIEKNYAAGKPVSDLSLSSIICYYDLSKAPVGATTIKDSSGNGYDLTKVSAKTWLDADDPEKEEVKDYDYTFAVVGDTQTLLYNTPDKFDAYYDWIINNKDAQKLEFVMGLGDITDKSEDWEWERAMVKIREMKDAGIPFSLIRGNHDTVDTFNSNVSYNEFYDTVTGTYDETMLNTYQRFTVGNRKYIILCLDYGPSDDVLAWAEDVIVAHPNHNVIITTHAYLYRDGTTLDDENGDLYPPSTTGGINNGDDMWEKLVKNHSNIVLVLSGHDPVSKIITNQTAGDNGNIVTSMLIDPQYDDANKHGLGLIALLRFSEDSDDIQVEYYSPITGKYYRACNQFTIELDFVEECAHTYDGGFCSACSEWDGETSVITGANIILRNDLSLNYYVKLPAAYIGAQMRFTIEGKDSVTVDGIYNKETNDYIYTFTEIAPQCMGDNILAELIFDENIIASKDNYSILQNAINLLNRYTDNEKTVSLVKAMLNYGAAAQVYADYKTDELVNAGYEIDATAPDSSVSVRNVENNTGDSVFKAAGVYFDSVNKLYVKILSTEKPAVTVNGTAAIVEAYGDGEWIVYTDGIFVIDFDTVYTFVITSNSNLPTFTYSVNSYAYAKQTSEDEKMVALATATYAYGVAAEAYINS